MGADECWRAKEYSYNPANQQETTLTMFKSLKHLLLLLMVVLPVIISVTEEGRFVAYAQEDEVDGEEDDIIDDDEVNVDDGLGGEVKPPSCTPSTQLKPLPDAPLGSLSTWPTMMLMAMCLWTPYTT